MKTFDVSQLNESQKVAFEEILAASETEARHILTGYAGTGKTFLMQAIASELKNVVVTAPTHKAVAVLRDKLDSAGIDVPCMTIHALLRLHPTADGEKQVLKRMGYDQRARPISYQNVIIDEASMLGEDLMKYIRSDLENRFVLFVGDPAQLPPVGEEASQCFGTRSKSNLDTIVRQEQDNPILKAAYAIRSGQGQMDWSWCAEMTNGAKGVFNVDADGDLDHYLEAAFTSDEFAANNDTFRYLCYTNARVHEINRKIRKWIYGYTSTPFVAGERVLCRKAVADGDQVKFNVNEEAIVKDVYRSFFEYEFPSHGHEGERDYVPKWQVGLSVWNVVLKHDFYIEVLARVPQSNYDLKRIEKKLIEEAGINRKRWLDRFTFLELMHDLRSIYAMTVHTSQGSTFDNVFVDVEDIRKREAVNLNEMRQLLYVAATRPRFALMMIGAHSLL